MDYRLRIHLPQMHSGTNANPMKNESSAKTADGQSTGKLKLNSNDLR